MQQSRVKFQLAEGEAVLADTNPPLTSLIFPLLELIVITGIAWIAIGWMDVTPFVNPQAHNIVVAVWALLSAWRFVLPVVRHRRQRFLLTDRRILARSARGAVDSIPLRQIHSFRRQRGGLSIALWGFDQPVFFPQVGKVRAVERALDESLRRR